MAGLTVTLDHARRLEEAGRLAEAERAYREFLRSDPCNVAALNLLGLLCHRLDRHGEAAALIVRATELRPDDAEALGNLGSVQMALGNGQAALLSFRRCVSVAPRWAAGWGNLGLALMHSNDATGAIQAFRHALELTPESRGYRRQLAAALFTAGDAAGAAEIYEAASLADPDDGGNWTDLGAARHRAGDLAGAEAALRHALRLGDRNAAAWRNLGTVESDWGNDDDAIRDFTRVLAIAPDDIDAHVFRGTCLLRQGRFAQGWADYEWRLRQRERPRVDRGFAQPRWRGEGFIGRRLLIHAEQGLGDTIQFIRYLPLVRKRGEAVLLEVQAPLLRLFAASPPCRGIEMIAQGTPLPTFDLHCPLLSLPAIFSTEISSIPGGIPYLLPDRRLTPALPHRRKRWRWGLAWAGNPRHPADRRRSLPANLLDPLGALEDVEFVSLQVLSAGAPERLALIDAVPVLGDFATTAALLADLDLIVTVDTALAHLAGAMGVPAWIMLSHVGDWRWMTGRNDSPWYPSVRLFRQPSPGDWAAVVEEVVAAWRALRMSKSAGDSAQQMEQARHHEQAGERNQAEAIYRAILAANPHNVMALNLLGLLCYRDNRLAEARALIERALLHQPRDAEAQGILAAVLAAQGELEAAVFRFRSATELAPENPAAWMNLGTALQNVNDFTAGRAALQRAVELGPDNASAWRKRGLLEAAAGDNDTALRLFAKAVSLDPEDPEAHVCLGLALLRAGRLREGWGEYEWRLDPGRAEPRDRGFKAPRWSGQACDEGRLLLYAEQGLGDTIHFLRYLPMVRARARSITLELQAPLHRLVSASEISRGIEIVARGDRLPPFDFCCPLASLPGVFGTDLASIPCDAPYLSPDPAWPTILAPGDGRRRVGLVWAGNPDYSNDRNRSMSGRLLDAFADLPHVEFVSLQKAVAVAPQRLALTDLGPRLDDFATTAAALRQTDLLISVDTSVAHLAGAMGRPVWLMLPVAADWRWLEGREDSPWYPSLRLFRQESTGDWGRVIERIRRHLFDWT